MSYNHHFIDQPSFLSVCFLHEVACMALPLHEADALTDPCSASKKHTLPVGLGIQVLISSSSNHKVCGGCTHVPSMLCALAVSSCVNETHNPLCVEKEPEFCMRSCAALHTTCHERNPSTSSIGSQHLALARRQPRLGCPAMPLQSSWCYCETHAGPRGPSSDDQSCGTSVK